MTAALPAEPASPVMTHEEFAKFIEFFYRKTGIQFQDSKKYYVERRIADRVRETRSDTFRDYFNLVRFQATGEELQHLVNAMTVNETYFLREDYQFDALVGGMLPEIARTKDRDSPIRIWSIPCSSGEEPYSIAISILERWIKPMPGISRSSPRTSTPRSSTQRGPASSAHGPFPRCRLICGRCISFRCPTETSRLTMGFEDRSISRWSTLSIRCRRAASATST
jgi:hypothetical protein